MEFLPLQFATAVHHEVSKFLLCIAVADRETLILRVGRCDFRPFSATIGRAESQWTSYIDFSPGSGEPSTRRRTASSMWPSFQDVDDRGRNIGAPCYLTNRALPIFPRLSLVDNSAIGSYPSGTRYAGDTSRSTVRTLPPRSRNPRRSAQPWSAISRPMCSESEDREVTDEMFNRDSPSSRERLPARRRISARVEYCASNRQGGSLAVAKL